MPDLIEITADLSDAARRSRGPLAQLDDAVRAIVLERYRKFLHLCKKHPNLPIAPTTDIDQMWHTHMLHPVAYFRDCQKYFGGILDHNGGFGHEPEELPKLKEIFESTSKLWEDEFGEPYVPAAGSGETCIKGSIETCFKTIETCFKSPIETCIKSPQKDS